MKFLLKTNSSTTHIMEPTLDALNDASPEFLRNISVGSARPTNVLDDYTDLVSVYPNAAEFIEKLSIITDFPARHIIDNFLKNYPLQRQLNHVRLVYSMDPESKYDFSELPYALSLYTLLETSPGLTRLSFQDFQPSPIFIEGCSDRLTRLDIGHVFPTLYELWLPIPPNLEVLSLTPDAASIFYGTPPASLRVIIIKVDNMGFSSITDDCVELLRNSTSVKSLGIIDNCKFFFLE